MSYNGRSQKTILQPDDLLRSLAGRNVKDMKIVFLDDNSIGTDIDLSGFEVLGEVVRYGSSKPEEVPDRVRTQMWLSSIRWRSMSRPLVLPAT